MRPARVENPVPHQKRETEFELEEEIKKRLVQGVGVEPTTGKIPSGF
jgi:hypothetical protein